MDSLNDNLMRIESNLGTLHGKFDGLLREMTRMVGQLDLHIQEDRQVHASQDERLLKSMRDMTERRAVEVERLNDRVDKIERTMDEDAGSRRAADRWRTWIIAAIGAASGFAGGILSHITLAFH